MKKLIFFTIAIAAVGISLPFACSKKVNGRTDDLAPLQPAKTDADAGNWKPVLLAGPTEFPVAAPVATNTPEYIAQVNEIKAWQANITD
ncbi:MAG: PA-phosphatase, partial [Bacteroidota bacterium]